MKKLRIIILSALAVMSAAYLISYGRCVSDIWYGTEHQFNSYLFDAPSIYFYQLRDAHGFGHGIPRVWPHLAIIGPPEIYHGVFRIPGWMPAMAAGAFLLYASYFIFSQYRRRVA
jgi:hypothetical protein